MTQIEQIDELADCIQKLLPHLSADLARQFADLISYSEERAEVVDENS